MRPLSFAVAALALMALVTGQQSGAAATIGMGVVVITRPLTERVTVRRRSDCAVVEE